MIVSFEFYVMNFVDFVVDCYSHITSYVSQTFASCTHNTSYSLLNIVYVIMCVFGLTNQVWKIFWVLCTTDLLLEKKRRDCLKYKFLGELGFKSWVCENHFISYSYICFFIIFQCFEERLYQILLIFKNSFFYNFDRSSLFFNQSKLRLKILVSLCLFRSIEYHESGFLKFRVWPVQNTFSKVFSTFLSLSPTRQSKIIQFLSFSSESFAKFSSPKAGKSILPFLLHFISCLHA